MNDDDTDLLAGLDLDAWAAPPPPAGLADRAIARVNATDQAIAVVQRRRSVKRRWWFAGGVAAALAASAVALVVIPHGSSTPSGSGAVVATAPQQLSVGGATATLDPGADVSWQHAGDAVHVAQRAGSATWKVERDQHLSLDIGAAVASIDASNATFRVETRMNLTDTRIAGVTAATAAAVALVTVYVYEGHVNVSGAGYGIVVERGETVEITPGDRPRKLDNVAGVPMMPIVPPVMPATPGRPVAAEPVPDLIVPIGERITIHDPRGQLRVAVDPNCAGQTNLLWPTGDGSAPMTATVASFSYTCNGIDKHGSIKLVRDPGFGVVIAPVEGASTGDVVHVMGGAVAARAQVTVNGKVVGTQNKMPWAIDVPFQPVLAVRVDGGVDEIDYYIRRIDHTFELLPEVTLDAGESVTIHDPTGRVRVKIAAKCRDVSLTLGSTNRHTYLADPDPSELGMEPVLGTGVHTYLQTCGGNDAGKKFEGKITVVQDRGTEIGHLTVPNWVAPIVVNGTFPTPNTIVRIGNVTPKPVLNGELGFFTAHPPTGLPGVIAVRFEVPGSGIHYLVARNEGAAPSHVSFDSDDDLDLAFKALEPSLLACVKHRAPGQMLSFDINVDGSVFDPTTTVDDAASEACLLDTLEKQRFPRQTHRRPISYTLDPGCDPKALVAAGNDLAANGEWPTALVKYDAAIDCKVDEHSLMLGFMAACNAHNVKFAAKYWHRLLPENRPRMLQMCVRNGITADQLTE